MLAKDKDRSGIKYSETFYSAQGEGQYTGIPSLWMRFFLCNLTCEGFGQTDPTDPSTYKPVGNDLDLTDITDIHDLPIFNVGCDSAYSVAKRYKHLMTDRTVTEAVDELTALLPHGKFQHPDTKQWVHMVFTGGEPMLKNTQPGIIGVLEEFRKRNNSPRHVTIETNGTKPLTPELEEYIDMFTMGGGEWMWSISPKLWSTAGEKPKKAIQPEVVGKYTEMTDRGQLKYVVNGSAESWAEVEHNTKLFREAGCDYPVWIMPEGATEEAQYGNDRRMSAGDIASEAIQRGYNVAIRAHVYLWGNTIGV